MAAPVMPLGAMAVIVAAPVMPLGAVAAIVAAPVALDDMAALVRPLRPVMSAPDLAVRLDLHQQIGALCRGSLLLRRLSRRRRRGKAAGHNEHGKHQGAASKLSGT